MLQLDDTDQDGAGTPPARRPVVTPAAAIAAGASAAAGLVHASAAGQHSGDAVLAWAFALLAAAQLGWAAWSLRRGGRVVHLVGIGIQSAALVGLALAATVGVPGIESLPGDEPLELQTGLVAGLQLTALLGSLAALRGAAPRSYPAGLAAGIGAVALLLALPAMTVAPGHAHSDGAGHGESSAGHHDDGGHAHEEGETAGQVDTAPWDPELVDVHASHPHPFDQPPSDEQLQDAVTLIEATKVASAAYVDVAAAEAAGFISIKDAFGPGDFEHYVSIEYNVDASTVDPTRPESLVYRWEDDGSKTLVSYMYILAPGQTMDDVPDIAGSLTPWHDHNDLCTDDQGIEILGVWDEDEERCDPGGTLDRNSAPMLHVWVTENRCGPFAGIESHGSAACDHGH